MMNFKKTLLAAASLLAVTTVSAQISLYGSPKYEFTTIKENPMMRLCKGWRKRAP